MAERHIGDTLDMRRQLSNTTGSVSPLPLVGTMPEAVQKTYWEYPGALPQLSGALLSSDTVRTFTLKKSSFFGTVLPMVLLLGGLAVFLAGVASLAVGKNWAPVLIVIGAVAAIIETLPFIYEVRRVELSDDGIVRFMYRRRVVTCQLAQVSVVSTSAPDPTSNWPVRFRTPTKSIRVCPQLTGIKDLMEAVRLANAGQGSQPGEN